MTFTVDWALKPNYHLSLIDHDILPGPQWPVDPLTSQNFRESELSSLPQLPHMTNTPGTSLGLIFTQRRTAVGEKHNLLLSERLSHSGLGCSVDLDGWGYFDAVY